MKAEEREHFKDRLKAEGRWWAYLARREELKRSRPELALSEVHKIAREEFERSLDADVARGVVAVEGADIPPVDVEGNKEARGAAVAEVKKGEGRLKVRDAVEWVFEHIEVDQVKAGDAPSAGAWALLSWVRRSPINQSEFYKTFASKMMPSQRQLDFEAQFEDDGSGVEGAIQRLLSVSDAVLPSDAEGPEQELAVSAGSGSLRAGE